jgi:hypothetical protein
LPVGEQGDLVLAWAGDGDVQVQQCEHPDLQGVGRLEGLWELLPPQHFPFQVTELHLDRVGAVGVAPAGEDRQILHHGERRGEDLVDG